MLIKEAVDVICAWTDTGAVGGRDRQVLQMIVNPMCLARLKSGRPGHPLYIANHCGAWESMIPEQSKLAISHPTKTNILNFIGRRFSWIRGFSRRSAATWVSDHPTPQVTSLYIQGLATRLKTLIEVTLKLGIDTATFINHDLGPVQILDPPFAVPMFRR